MAEDLGFDIRHLAVRGIAALKNDLYGMAAMANPCPTFTEFRDRYIEALLCDAIVMAQAKEWDHIPKVPMETDAVGVTLQNLASRLVQLARELDRTNDYSITILRRETSRSPESGLENRLDLGR